MATGVKPRDEDHQFTRSDLDAIQGAMKNKKFREMLSDYCNEINDPANKELYQKEMTQLEKERGYDVKFLNPKGGYVIKTSVAGDRKAFINICSNDNIGKPSYKVQEMDGKRGMNWQIPYSIIPPRDDYDHKRERCVIYDVVYHPDTLRMAEVNKQFRDLVNKTAYEGLQKTYNIHFDSNNFRFPKSHYKGMTTPAVIRKEDPNYKPPTEDDEDVLTPEMMEKLYPQRVFPSSESNDETNEKVMKENTDPKQARKLRKGKPDFTHNTEEGYTIPKYSIKQQKDVEMQEFTYHKDCKQHSAIPSQIIVEIHLPLLSSTKDCSLDVKEKALSLISEKPAKYKLNILLPYTVNDECGNAKFDKAKRKLIVTLPVVRRNYTSENNSKVDSGVESEENSGSQSDEDQPNLIVELPSKPSENIPPLVELSKPPSERDSFFDTSLGYILPPYTHNILDDIVAFTFHVKNTEPDSLHVKNEDSKIYIKFTSVGSGFVPVHYAAILMFDDNVTFENVSGEAWDNNVILQLELAGDVPQKFQIGLSHDSMASEYFDMSQVKKAPQMLEDSTKQMDETLTPVVEVTNMGSETNIVVSSNTEEYDEDDDDDTESPNEREIVWTESNSSSGAKSILRKPMSMMRSFSESSAGDVASSMDYISSDCIPEESSYKKTVRFNDVISKQFYRYNSSIEGQKKKNQRKKSKKRSLERRKSESEAEDDSNNNTQSKPRSALKQRRDSGLADTSDAEGESKTSDECTNEDSNGHPKSILNIVDNKESPEIWETKKEKVKKPVTCETVKHNTDFYNPDKLNKGQYLEVAFKNDLIFDLDM